MKNKRKRKCYNCAFKSASFKIDNLTHLHCLNIKIYGEDGLKRGQTSAWHTLRVFSDTCEEHEFKRLF